MIVQAYAPNEMILRLRTRNCRTCSYDFATRTNPPVPFVVTPMFAGHPEEIECLACVLRRVRSASPQA